MTPGPCVPRRQGGSQKEETERVAGVSEGQREEPPHESQMLCREAEDNSNEVRSPGAVSIVYRGHHHRAGVVTSTATSGGVPGMTPHVHPHTTQMRSRMDRCVEPPGAGKP